MIRNRYTKKDFSCFFVVIANPNLHSGNGTKRHPMSMFFDTLTVIGGVLSEDGRYKAYVDTFNQSCGTSVYDLGDIIGASSIKDVSFDPNIDIQKNDSVISIGTGSGTIQASSPIFLTEGNEGKACYQQSFTFKYTIYLPQILIIAYKLQTISLEVLCRYAKMSISFASIIDEKENYLFKKHFPDSKNQTYRFSSLYHNSINQIKRIIENQLIKQHQETNIQDATSHSTFDQIDITHDMSDVIEQREHEIAMSCLHKGFLPPYEQYLTYNKGEKNEFDGHRDSRKTTVENTDYGKEASQAEQETMLALIRSLQQEDILSLEGKKIGYPGGGGSDKLDPLLEQPIGASSIVTTDRSVGALQQKTKNNKKAVYGDYMHMGGLRHEHPALIAMMGGDFGNLITSVESGTVNMDIPQRCRHAQQTFLDEAYRTLPDDGYLMLGIFTTQQDEQQVQRRYGPQQKDNQRYGFDTGVAQPLLSRRQPNIEQETHIDQENTSSKQEQFLGTRNKKGHYTGGKVTYEIRDTPVPGGRMVELGYRCNEDMMFEDPVTGKQIRKKKGDFVCINPTFRFDLNNTSVDGLPAMYTKAGFELVRQQYTPYGGAVLVLKKKTKKRDESVPGNLQQTPVSGIDKQFNRLRNAIRGTKIGLGLLLGLSALSGIATNAKNYEEEVLRTSALAVVTSAEKSKQDVYNLLGTDGKLLHHVYEKGLAYCVDLGITIPPAMQVAYLQYLTTGLLENSMPILYTDSQLIAGFDGPLTAYDKQVLANILGGFFSQTTPSQQQDRAIIPNQYNFTDSTYTYEKACKINHIAWKHSLYTLDDTPPRSTRTIGRTVQDGIVCPIYAYMQNLSDKQCVTIYNPKKREQTLLGSFRKKG